MQEQALTRIKETPDEEPGPVDLRANELIAYRVTEWPPMRLVPAPRTREWMDATRNRFAYRCLPLLIANQSGWWVLNSHAVRVVWTGGWDPTCVRVQSLDIQGQQLPVSGHFGEGVVTFNLPWLFRTPPGINLHARGPANLPKDGIQALEGIIETDWTFATFTMNWKFTRPNFPITFERDEPICTVVPEKRSFVEEFDPTIRDVREDEQTLRLYNRWSESRSHFIKASRIPETAEFKEGWQKHYFQGIDIEGTPAQEHQSKLALKEFVDKGPFEYPPLPEVKAHPEALGYLAMVGAGRLDAYEAFQHISYYVYRYHYQYITGQQGSTIGAMMCRALFPDLANATPIEELQKHWDSLRNAPFDGLFAEAGVASFVTGCASASSDPNIERGSRMLWEQRLRKFLPPPEGMFQSENPAPRADTLE